MELLWWLSLYCAECFPRMSPTSSWLKVQEDTSSISVRLNWWKTTGWPHFSRAFGKYPKPFLLLVASDQCIYSCFASFSSQVKSLHESEEILKGFHSSCQDDMALESVAVSASVALPFQWQKYFSGERGEKLYSCTPELEDDLERTPLFECVSLGLGTLVWQTRFFPIKAL